MARFHERRHRQAAVSERIGTRPLPAGAGWTVMAGIASTVLALLGGCATQTGGETPHEEAVTMSRQTTAARQTRPEAVQATPLKGTLWRLQSLGGKPVPAGNDTPTLVLQPDNDGFGGHAGCNRYFGSYRLTGDRISFGGIGVTKRMCGVAQMRREGAFLGVLRSNLQLRLEGEVLVLADAGGREMARFTAAGRGADEGMTE